jgi:hypothetical protein
MLHLSRLIPVLLGIFPMLQMEANTSITRTSSDGTSAWLFIGTNSSYVFKDGLNVIHYPLDIGNVPATYNSTHHWSILDPRQAPEYEAKYKGPLATVLLCDPRMNLSSALVTLSPSNSLSIAGVRPSPVGNISPGSAAFVLSQSLLKVTDVDPRLNDLALNLLSARLFLQQPFNSQDNYFGTAYVRSASNISSTIGAYVSSAAKAWSDGYWETDRYSTVVRDAIEQKQSLAIVGNVPLGIVAGILAVLLLALATVQLWMARAETLGIASLKEALESIRKMS